MRSSRRERRLGGLGGSIGRRIGRRICGQLAGSDMTTSIRFQRYLPQCFLKSSGISVKKVKTVTIKEPASPMKNTVSMIRMKRCKDM